MSINQLLVKVDGWMKLTNVTVDRVGVYFRHAEPDITQAKGLAGVSVELDITQVKGSWGML